MNPERKLSHVIFFCGMKLSPQNTLTSMYTWTLGSWMGISNSSAGTTWPCQGYRSTGLWERKLDGWKDSKQFFRDIEWHWIFVVCWLHASSLDLALNTISGKNGLWGWKLNLLVNNRFPTPWSRLISQVDGVGIVNSSWWSPNSIAVNLHIGTVAERLLDTAANCLAPVWA